MGYGGVKQLNTLLRVYSQAHSATALCSSLGSLGQKVNSKKPLEIRVTVHAVYTYQRSYVNCSTYLKCFFAIYYLPQSTK